MVPFKNPPAGLIQAPDNFFRRKEREIVYYLSTAFRLHLAYFFGCAMILLFHLLIMNTQLVARFENVFCDFFFRTRPPIAQNPAIVHIDMAEDSLQALGRWPWPRAQHAVMVHILKEWGAKEIVFDVVFSEPSTSFDDGALAQAIKEAGNVYLAVMLESAGGQKGWVRSLPEFEAGAKGIGHVNIFPDRDGTIRRVKPWVEYNGESYPYLGAKAVFGYLGREVPPGRMGVPTDQDGQVFINWVGKWQDSFQHYSFVDVIKSYAEARQGRKPFIAPDQIKDKICVIGLTALGLTDIKAAPMQEAYPAVGVQTNIMNSILTKQYMRPVNPRWNRIALIAIGLLVSFFFIFSRQVISFVIGLGFGFLWIGLAFWIFVSQGVWIYVLNPILVIFSLFVFSAVFSLTVGKKERERLFDLATRDGLTGLFVIRHFRALMNETVILACRRQQPLSIILLDLDHFKMINDKFGHVAGDAVLKHVADHLVLIAQSEENAEDNVLGRYGGEEFILMFKKCSLNDAAFNYAEKIRRQIEQDPPVYNGVKIPLTVSLGVSTLRPRETVPDLMVLRADEALYRAKTEGRNRVCIERGAEDEASEA